MYIDLHVPNLEKRPMVVGMLPLMNEKAANKDSEESGVISLLTEHSSKFTSRLLDDHLPIPAGKRSTKSDRDPLTIVSLMPKYVRFERRFKPDGIVPSMPWLPDRSRLSS